MPRPSPRRGRVRALIEREVAAVNAGLASFESVKRFHILPEEFTVESGDLTPSLKVKRRVVARRFEHELADIEAQYSQLIPDHAKSSAYESAPNDVDSDNETEEEEDE